MFIANRAILGINSAGKVRASLNNQSMEYYFKDQEYKRAEREMEFWKKKTNSTRH